MKKCEEFQGMISAYVDGELADAETSKLFFHLGECGKCRIFMKSILQLRSALQEIESASHAPSPAAVPVWKRKFSISYPVAAVIALAVMLSSFFLSNKILELQKMSERVETQYVYMTSFPPVYVYANSSVDIRSN